MTSGGGACFKVGSILGEIDGDSLNVAVGFKVGSILGDMLDLDGDSLNVAAGLELGFSEGVVVMLVVSAWTNGSFGGGSFGDMVGLEVGLIFPGLFFLFCLFCLFFLFFLTLKYLKN
jgi:hypothetical protein